MGPAARRQMQSLPGCQSIWVAGAWVEHGFHEDGLSKRIDAALVICKNPEANLGIISCFYLQYFPKLVSPPSREAVLYLYILNIFSAKLYTRIF